MKLFNNDQPDKGPRTKVKPFHGLSALYPIANDTLELEQAATLMRPLSVRVFERQRVVLIETSSAYGIARYT